MRIIKQLIPKKEFLVAVSGGIDSLAVCLYLKQKRHKFIAIHFNGNFLKQDLLAESKVVDFCWMNQIPLITEIGINNYTKGSKEEYCREERYKAFNKACKEFDIHEIISGHNLNDCVASYLWNCFRGHTDFNPIPFKSSFPNFEISRPFLLASKKELREYAKTVYPMISNYVTEDELNNDLSLNRNWLNKVVIPMVNSKNFNLEKVTKKIVERKWKNFIDNREVLE